MTKESFVKAIKSGVKEIKRLKGLVPEAKNSTKWAIDNWDPKTRGGRFARKVMKNPMKATMAAGGVVGGTAMAASGANQAFKASKSTTSDPYALARRRARGFRRG